MNGLYALKPWYADRLARPRALLIRHNVTPAAVSWTGVGCAAGAGAALALLPQGGVAAVVVAVALAARLACANLDGGLARAAGTSTRWGGVVNELSDRLADIVAIAGLLPIAGVTLTAVAIAAATAPSWVSLAGTAAGARRVQGGPLGKTERCAVLVIAAATGAYAIAAVVIAAGSLLTAMLRLAVVRRELRGAR